MPPTSRRTSEIPGLQDAEGRSDNRTENTSAVAYDTFERVGGRFVRRHAVCSKHAWIANGQSRLSSCESGDSRMAPRLRGAVVAAGSGRRSDAVCLSPARGHWQCVARRSGARSGSLRLPLFRAGVLAVLQFEADGCHDNLGAVAPDRRLGRRAERRRSGPACGAGRLRHLDDRVDCPDGVARPSRQRRRLLLRDGPRWLQGRPGVLPGEHTASRSVRLQRGAWRLLGAFGVFHRALE